ncbi:MAG: restriction endonuclease [Candidatus Hodarchaeales archaeon]|jgi:HJR/Mrr/RecB family endonuclease
MSNCKKQTHSVIGYLKGRRKLLLPELISEFNLSVEKASEILSSLKKNDIIVYNDNNQEIEINEDVKLDYELPLPTYEELCILGYCNLRRIVSVNEISTRLVYPLENVKNIIFINIALNRLLASIGLQKSLFKSSKLFIRVNNDQNRNTNIFTEFQEIIPKEIILETKKITGILFLKREASLATFIKDIVQQNRKNYSEVDLLRMFSILALDTSVQVHLDDNDWVKFHSTKTFQAKIDSSMELEEFNTSALLGILAKTNSISLKSIAKELSTPNREWKTNEILDQLSRLTIEGVITGFLDDDIFHLSKMKATKVINSLSLDRGERIFLGMLRSKDQVSLKDVSRMLDASSDTARLIFFQLSSQQRFKGEISMGGRIIVHQMPSFPFTTHVQELPRLDRELFGYILARKRVELKEIEKIWILSSLEAEKIIYDLIGLGVLNASLINGLVKLHEVYKSPKLPDSTLIEQESLLNQIVDILENQEEPVDLKYLEETLNLSENQIIKTLSLLVGDGYYHLGHFQGNLFNKGGKIKGLFRKYIRQSLTSISTSIKLVTLALENDVPLIEVKNILKESLASQEIDGEVVDDVFYTGSYVSQISTYILNQKSGLISHLIEKFDINHRILDITVNRIRNSDPSIFTIYSDLDFFVVIDISTWDQISSDLTSPAGFKIGTLLPVVTMSSWKKIFKAYELIFFEYNDRLFMVDGLQSYTKNNLAEINKILKTVRQQVPHMSISSNRKKEILISFEQLYPVKPVLLPYFCQIDNTMITKAKSAYVCVDCNRTICPSCYNVMIQAGKASCINCNGELIKQPSLQLEMDLDRVANMDRLAFENFLEGLFRTRGYRTENIQHSRNHTVNLMIIQGVTKLGVQVKRYNPKNMIDKDVLIQLKQEKNFNECDNLMVVTTSYFTRPAVEYAKKVGIELWDRDVLHQYLKEYNKHLKGDLT